MQTTRRYLQMVDGWPIIRTSQGEQVCGLFPWTNQPPVSFWTLEEDGK